MRHEVWTVVIDRGAQTVGPFVDAEAASDWIVDQWGEPAPPDAEARLQLLPDDAIEPT